MLFFSLITYISPNFKFHTDNVLVPVNRLGSHRRRRHRKRALTIVWSSAFRYLVNSSDHQPAHIPRHIVVPASDTSSRRKIISQRWSIVQHKSTDQWAEAQHELQHSAQLSRMHWRLWLRNVRQYIFRRAVIGDEQHSSKYISFACRHLVFGKFTQECLLLDHGQRVSECQRSDIDQRQRHRELQLFGANVRAGIVSAGAHHTGAGHMDLGDRWICDGTRRLRIAHFVWVHVCAGGKTKRRHHLDVGDSGRCITTRALQILVGAQLGHTHSSDHTRVHSDDSSYRISHWTVRQSGMLFHRWGTRRSGSVAVRSFPGHCEHSGAVLHTITGAIGQ